ncbi:MAG: adenylyl-sulfate kinase [Hahellaceae bacterium]|nr:adenylyl-sulfate kinase [Hahellaceae bacterium]MCP5209643.1 adenylyl-sulfate kinase [Hahellaceae bacterium]
MFEENLVWHKHHVGKKERSIQKGQQPCLMWFTGLSGAGKSTIADLVEQELYNRGHHTYLLDGDNVRKGLNKDLGFSDEDRVENIRRIGEVAKLLVDSGLIVLSAFISPFKVDRQMVRELFPDGEFVEIFVSTPIEVCEKRDPKGLYRKARAGQIKQFTGVDSAYEAPHQAEITVDASYGDPRILAGKIVTYLEISGYCKTFEKAMAVK